METPRDRLREGTRPRVRGSAFRAARRQLQDEVRRQAGAVGQHGRRGAATLLLDRGAVRLPTDVFAFRFGPVALAEGVAARHQRHGEAARRAVRAWGLEVLCRNPRHYSGSLTAVLMHEGHSADNFRKVTLNL